MGSRFSRRQLLKAGLLGAGSAVASYAFGLPGLSRSTLNARADDLPWDAAQLIVDQTVLPTFSDAIFDVTDPTYGAVPDGLTDCTDAFRAAIEDCSSSGGGHVVVPPGSYKTGAIRLLSNVDLHLENSRLLFSDNPTQFPVVLTRYEGIECMNYSPMVYAYGQTNISVTGNGALDASGTSTWNTGADRDYLETLVARGVPPEQRYVPGSSRSLRSNFVEPYNCTNVLIQGVSLVGAQFWQIHPTLCRNVTVDGVTTSNQMVFNSDGCDPECCDHVVIKNSTLAAYDDCIAIKSGRDDDGRRVNIPSKNIVIFNCNLRGPIAGVACGSEMTGGIENVYVYNVQFSGDNLGSMLYVKSNTRRGGYARNINLDNVWASGVGSQSGPIWGYAHMDYVGQQGPYLPVFENWSISHAYGIWDALGFSIHGREDSHVRGFNVSDSSFTLVRDPIDRYDYVDGINFSNVTINGQLVSQ